MTDRERQLIERNMADFRRLRDGLMNGDEDTRDLVDLLRMLARRLAIKVSLPGESLWATPVGKTDDGRIIAELRNHSIHDIPWGTRVELGKDGRTIVAPPEVVAKAQANVDGEWPEGDPQRGGR